MKALFTQLFFSLFIVSGVYAQIPSYVPTSGLQGWWPFNGNANDESGNGNNGTVNGASLTSDRNSQTNRAFSFNGSTNYVTISNPNSFQIQNYISISVWIYMSGGSTNPRIIQFGNNNFDEYGIETQGTSNISRVVNGFFGGFPSNSTLTSQTWHHVVYTCNRVSGNSKIYFDGVQVVSNTSSAGGPLSYASCNLTIGRKPCNNSDYFGGNIDDIGVWNRVLTQAEITALYQATIPVTATASTISNVACFNGGNGSAIATPSSGTPPYSYSWNTSPVQTTQTATGLRAGTYTVTVTDSKGSVATANATITQPSAITNVIANTVSNVGCFGGNNGSVRVTNPVGGTPPYTYYWNTNPVQVTQTASNVPAGTYTVVVTDANGCTANASSTVSQPTQALSNIVGQTVKNVLCNGTATGSVTVTNPIGGTPPYTYQWNTSPIQTTQTAANLPAGTYTVNVTDANGCTGTSFATVTEPAAISNVKASVFKNVQCFGEANGSAIVSDPRGGTPPYTYQWNTSPVQTTQTAVNLKAGEYTVIVTDKNGCIAQSMVTVNQPSSPLAIGSAIVDKQNTCYGQSEGKITAPTPTGGTSPYTIQWNTTPPRTTYTIDGLKAGSYLATITDANGCIVTTSATINQPQKVVVNSPRDTTVLIQTKAELKSGSNNGSSTYQWQSNTGTGFQNLQNVFQFTGVTTPILTIDNCTQANHNQPFRCVITTNGCTDTTSIALLTIRTNVGVENQQDATSLVVYPNPTGEADEVLVKLGNVKSQVLHIELIDMMGIAKAYTNIDSQSGTFPISISGLAKGMYIIRVKTISGIITDKVIVN